MLRLMVVKFLALSALAATFVLPEALRASPALDRTSWDTDNESSRTILDHYLSAIRAQDGKLRGVTMTIDIQAELPKLKKQGRFHALRIIPKVGKITYDALKFEGDKTVKTDVIARYLAAEDQAQQAGSPSALAITPENYKFKFKGEEILGDRSSYVFQLTPKKKRVGLFKGDLWIDKEYFLPLRESGRFVKNPSVFLKKIEFVRDFEIKDGVAIPRRIISQVDTRIVGPAAIAIDFSDVKPDAQASTSLLESGGGLPQN